MIKILTVFVWLLGMTLLFWPLFGSNPNTTLWADDFDSNLLKWIAEWGYYSLGQQHSLSLFWNANSFYPEPLTLAYSDSLLSLQLFYTPLRFFGLAPLSALYLSLALFTLLSVNLTVRALSRFEGLSRIEIATITFMAHFSLPMTNFLGHYQLFGFQLVAPFFLYLFWYLRALQAKDLITLSLIFALAVSFSVYLAPMLSVTGAIFALPSLIANMKELGPKQLLKRIGWIGPASACIIVLILYLVQLRPYFQLAALFPPQSYEETEHYSANLLSLINLPSINSFWFAPSSGQYSTYGDWERAYFPGLITLFILLLFIGRAGWVGLSNIRVRGEFKILGVLALALLILCYLLSLGPYIGDGRHRGPFWYVAELTSSFRSIRAPGRFGMFFALPLGVLVVMLAREFRLNTALKTALFLLLAIESLTKFRIFPYDEPKSAVYREVAEKISTNTPLLELPISGGEHIASIRVIMEQLNGSSYHHGKLVVGYGGKTTSTYQEALYLDQQLQAGALGPDELVEFGKKLGIKHLLIHLDRYSEDNKMRWLTTLSALQPIIESDKSLLVRVAQ